MVSSVLPDFDIIMFIPFFLTFDSVSMLSKKIISFFIFFLNNHELPEYQV